MRIKLVFERSGDELEFVPVNHEVVEYYLDHLDKNNLNNFVADDSTYNGISRSINELQKSIRVSNEFIQKLTGNKFDEYSELECLDQYVLNKSHSYWVNIQTTNYSIQEYRSNGNRSKNNEIDEKLHHGLPDEISVIPLLQCLDILELSQTYCQINENVHILEESFNSIKFSNNSYFSISNPFSKFLLSNDICNLRIAFNHRGRTLYNKFLTFDDKLEHLDENSYDQLLGFVSLHLCRPQTINLSSEYINWCKERNVVPSGNFLNIGNLVDIQNRLTEYRQVVYRNLKSNNKFKLLKG